MITTSRRTYYPALVSPAKPATHAPRVKFYCPQDLFQQANGVFRATATERKRDPEATVVRFLLVAVDALNFNSRSAYVSWRPVRVFDDGTHVDIQMPGAMRVTETPARLVQTRTGDTALVSYRLHQRYYVVDKLFDTAVLVVGVGTHQERAPYALVAMPSSVGFTKTWGVRVSRSPLNAGLASHRVLSPSDTFITSSPASSSTSQCDLGRDDALPLAPAEEEPVEPALLFRPTHLPGCRG